MKFLWILTALLLVPGVGTAASTEPTLEQVVTAVEAPFQAGSPVSLQDLKAGFRQVSHIVTLDQTQDADGQLWLQYDRTLPEKSLQSRFRWIYTQPLEQLFISNGLKIWVYLPDNNQVIVSEATGLEQKPGMQNPVTLLTGLGELSRDFSIAWAPERKTADGNYRIRLTPKVESPYLAIIDLVVNAYYVQEAANKAYFPLTGLTVVDTSENRTELRFTEARVNEGVSPSLFQFTPPPGTDIVRPEDLAPGS